MAAAGYKAGEDVEGCGYASWARLTAQSLRLGKLQPSAEHKHGCSLTCTQQLQHNTVQWQAENVIPNGKRSRRGRPATITGACACPSVDLLLFDNVWGYARTTVGGETRRLAAIGLFLCDSAASGKIPFDSEVH